MSLWRDQDVAYELNDIKLLWLFSASLPNFILILGSIALEFMGR